MQNTSNLLMIKPVNFGFNEETASNNAFQFKDSNSDVQTRALNEFNNYVKKLEENGINVLVVEDTPKPYTPDSIFPNNWISFHEDGRLCLYPMFALNRRQERKNTVMDAINNKFSVKNIVDLTKFENENLFLEGTGSMVLDRDNKIVYACLSERTNIKVLNEFAKIFGYSIASFNAVDKNGLPIYHTNVVMSVSEQIVVICLDAVNDASEKEMLLSTIKKSNKELLEISFEQMSNFAGNMLQVKNDKGKQFMVMSKTAYNILDAKQIDLIKKYNEIIAVDIDTIERNGGGSARCMLAEIFLNRK
ncbi:MAG: amidinotransferase [Bacteroidetes bacterium]|nr:amidinotransferase [Bacteroidota bacterium]